MSAEEIITAVRAAGDQSVPTLRRLRRRASGDLKDSEASEVLHLARELLAAADQVPRWFTYELVHHHHATVRCLNPPALRELGRGMNDWGEVDPFACYLAGVAWREGTLPDEEVHRWAASDDRWWRRAALVSTVPLNAKARGGEGDARRTLDICNRLRADRDPMVVKAMSWALRTLAVRDPEAVRAYLAAAGEHLAPRVRREVRNKLETGVKRSGKART